MSIFESLVLDSWSQLFLRKHSGNRSGFKMRLSQRKLNCALSVDFLWKKKITDRTNPGCSKEDSGNESQIISRFTAGFSNFRFSHGNRYVFNGEFDSGSERTLAAWIRHASRAGFLLVAIPREIQR